MLCLVPALETPEEMSRPPPDSSAEIPVLDELLVSLRIVRGEKLYSGKATAAGHVLAPHHVRLLRRRLAGRCNWASLDVDKARALILEVAPPGNGDRTRVIETLRTIVRDQVAGNPFRLRRPLLGLREDIFMTLREERDFEITWPFLEAVFVILLTS